MSKNIFVTIVFALFSLNILAQNGTISTGYFNEGYLYRHRMNPALTPEMGYVSLPFFNINAGVNSNLSARYFIYAGKPLVNGKIQTFMSPDVSPAAALKPISMINSVNAGFDLTMASVGFYNKKGNIYTTVELDFKGREYSTIPKGFFELMKFGAEENMGRAMSYNLGGLALDLSLYSQLSFGQSYKIGEKLKIGYKVKWLNSFVYADMYSPQLNVNAVNSISVTETLRTSGSGTLRMQGIRLRYVDEIEEFDMNFRDILASSLSNFGFNFDLGFSYDILDWLHVSASITDLGLLMHQNMQNNILKVTDKANPLENADELLKLLEEIFNFVAGDPISLCAVATPFTVRAGAQAELPSYRKLSFGALYTHQIAFHSNAWELRGSANYDVAKCLSLSASYAFGSYGSQFGFLAAVHIPGFNLFVGADSIPLRYMSRGIPYSNGNVNVHLGIAFQFGKYRGKYNQNNK